MTRKIHIELFIACTMLSINAGCSDRAPHSGPEPDQATAPAGPSNEPTGAQSVAVDGQKAEAVSVPSDPGAAYELVSLRALPNGNREAVTRRSGPSGISYARREIDCDGMQFRYVGEGDTLKQALGDAPNPGEMAELVPGSISTEVSIFVCAK